MRARLDVCAAARTEAAHRAMTTNLAASDPVTAGTLLRRIITEVRRHEQDRPAR